MKEVTIYIVRHGESLGNKERKMLGHTDLDLSEHGYKQAECAAKALADVKFDKIYSSDLKRAYNTAVPHAKMRGMEVIGDAKLREIRVGEWENLCVDEVEARYGELYTVEWIKNYGCFAFPGGESTVEAGERFYNALVETANENEGKTILVVSHGAVIRSSWAKILGIPKEKVAAELPFVSNASYSVLKFDGEKFEPIKYGEDNYMSEIGITKIKY